MQRHLYFWPYNFCDIVREARGLLRLVSPSARLELRSVDYFPQVHSLVTPKKISSAALPCSANWSATKVDPRSKFNMNIPLTMGNHISSKEDATIDISSAIDIFVDFRLIRLYEIG